MKQFEINTHGDFKTGKQIRAFINFMEREYPNYITDKKKVEAHNESDFQWFVKEFFKSIN